MKSSLEATGETHAPRRTVVSEALDRLKIDILAVPPSASGIFEQQVELLIATLAELGPVFSQFGRYLGTRYDFFRPEACLPLAETGTVRLLSDLDLVQAHTRHFPDSAAEWLQSLRPEPTRSDHLLHYYRWPGRSHLSIRVLSPAFLDYWTEDEELLKKLVGPARRIWPQLPVNDAIDDFRSQIESTRDLDGTAQAYRSFHGERQNSTLLGQDSFGLPEVADEFCTPGILSVEEPAPGAHIPTAHAAFEDLFSAEQTNAARVEAARNLSLTWLRLAMRGAWYPENLSPRHLGIAQDGTLYVLGGNLVAPSHEAQEYLCRYLCAVGANQPDAAADILVTHLQPGRRAKGIQEVRDLFRQIVPYRDGQINQSGDHELFAEHVVAQLRIIREAGYEPDDHLVAFQSSFGSVGRLAHNLSPRRDAFKDALYGFRWSDLLANIRNLFTFGAVGKQSQDWLNLIMEIPEKMNLAAQGRGLAQSNPLPESKKAARPRSASLLLAAHVFVMLILGWLFHGLLAHERGSGFLPAVVVISIIGTGISMIRCLLPHR